jgi:hypothetical protein
LRAIFTPGHSADHLCFHLEEENSLFSGDCILGETSAEFEDLHTYMESLNRILEVAPTVIYPGHGPVVKTNACKRIADYIDHRKMRNQQILDTLAKNGRPMTVEELVTDIYIVKNYLVVFVTLCEIQTFFFIFFSINFKGLDDLLIPAASINVHNHLTWLMKQDKVKSSKLLKFNLIQNIIFKKM